MSAESAADRAAMLHADGFGVAAIYTPAGGSPVACTVILDQPASEGSLGRLGVVQSAYQAWVSIDDVAAPAEGDGLVVGSQSFIVRTPRAELDGGFWKLDLALQDS